MFGKNICALIIILLLSGSVIGATEKQVSPLEKELNEIKTKLSSIVNGQIATINQVNSNTDKKIAEAKVDIDNIYTKTLLSLHSSMVSFLLIFVITSFLFNSFLEWRQRKRILDSVYVLERIEKQLMESDSIKLSKVLSEAKKDLAEIKKVRLELEKANKNNTVIKKRGLLDRLFGFNRDGGV